MPTMITGGAGSLGTVLAMHLMDSDAFGDRRVVVYSRGEWTHDVLMTRLKRYVDEGRLVCATGDVRDRERLEQVIRRYSPNHVVHAAALKQVPCASSAPSEYFDTNVRGTRNVAEVCARFSIGAVYISSDKAVYPTTLYGITKALGERLWLDVARDARGPLSVLRYGNVLGSRGSVLVRFLGAKACGEPLRVSSMTRFWLTLDEAADWCLRCLMGASRGQVIVPRLKAAPVALLAKAVGGTVEPLDVVRPGLEKRAETLLAEEETAYLTTPEPMHYPTYTLPADRCFVLDYSAADLSGWPACQGDVQAAYASDGNDVPQWTLKEMKEAVNEYREKYYAWNRPGLCAWCPN